MEWDKQATELHERLPIPPNVSVFAQKQAEKIAINKGKRRVTVKEVQETEEAYATHFGKEKTQEMRNLQEGKEPIPQMVDELFFDASGMLYNILVCPVKYGSQSEEVTEGILSVFRGLKEIFKREDLERVIAGLSRTPLDQSGCFTVVIDGCSNCCEPPFTQDLGIVGQHIPEVTDVKCLQCGKCLDVCYEDAITLEADGPIFNREKCINCEFCAKSCPGEKIVIGKRGYKIIAGGRNYRHPAIAKTVIDFTDRDGALATAEKMVSLLKKGKEGDTLKSLIEEHGIAVIQ